MAQHPTPLQVVDDLDMQVRFTKEFVEDARDLPHPLPTRVWALIEELQSEATPKSLKPGWRFHGLESSPFASISLDMNFRVLVKRDADGIILCRAAKHDDAYRRSTLEVGAAEASGEDIHFDLRVEDLYDSLMSFGVPVDECKPFRGLSDEDQLLDALGAAIPSVSRLALALYETSGVVVPKGGIRMLHRDDELEQLLTGAGEPWQIYLHPSQEFIVELPVGYRAAVVGSAGTGKTVSAWHRAKSLIQSGHSIGFVCPDERALSVSRTVLANLTDDRGSSFFLVPRGADELVQLAEVVDHLLLDESQELPTTWLKTLAHQMPESVGVTMYYDLNQLGGHITNGDTRRYRQRVTDWKAMLSTFPHMHKLKLSINYRNSREVAEYYLALLAEALPAAPSAEVPTFESGEVVVHGTAGTELTGVVAGLLRRLLREYEAREIGVAMMPSLANKLTSELGALGLSVTSGVAGNSVTVARASAFRGHERKAMIVVIDAARSVSRNFGVAIDAYIAMSRAIHRLIVIEVK